MRARLILYKHMGKKDVFVGEIDKLDGAPKKIMGRNLPELETLVKANLRCHGIEKYDIITDPRERHGKLKESVPPDVDVRALSKDEARLLIENLRS